MSTSSTPIDAAAVQAAGSAMPTTPFASYDHLQDFPAAESDDSFIMVSPSKEKEGGGGAFHAANTALAVDHHHYASTQAVEEITSQRFLETVRNKIAKADLLLASYGSIAATDKIQAFLSLHAAKSNTHCPTILFAEGSSVVHGEGLVQVATDGCFDAKDSINVSTSPHAAAAGGAMRSRCHIVVCVGLVGLEDSTILKGQHGGLVFTKSEMVLPLWLGECRPVKGGGDNEIAPTPQHHFYTPDMIKRISKIPAISILPASVCAGGVRRKGGK